MGEPSWKHTGQMLGKETKKRPAAGSSATTIGFKTGEGGWDSGWVRPRWGVPAGGLLHCCSLTANHKWVQPLQLHLGAAALRRHPC